MAFDDLVFVGFNSRVAALDRETGETVWTWRATQPKFGGYVTLLLDGDRLVVSVNGYMYCLDPSTGDELWFNGTKGLGTGVASIASVRGQASALSQAAAAAQAAAASAAAAGAS